MNCLVILAGGKSSRMGKDKVFLRIKGKTFLEHLFLRASDVFDRIIISTDTVAHKEEILGLGLWSELALTPEIVVDSYSAIGPMGGILSVFESTDTKRFSIISVDVPEADMNVLAALYDLCERKACFFLPNGGRVEPLIAAYDRSSADVLRSAFEQQLYKLRAALTDDDITIVSEEELTEKTDIFKGVDAAKAFANYNTPGDYAAIENGD